MKLLKPFGRAALLLAAAAVVSFSLASCSDDDDPVPAGGGDESRFTMRMDSIREEIVWTPDSQDIYEHIFYPVLTVRSLYEGEKILQMGIFYAPTPDPDTTDMGYSLDCSNMAQVQEWDWKETYDSPTGGLHLTGTMFMLRPDVTYYARGYVRTNRDVYYTNNVEIRSNFTAPPADNPDAYVIPVVFHFFPNPDGSYPIKPYMAEEWVERANLAYANYYGISHLAETNVRFCLAEEAPEGRRLDAPGIVYETDSVMAHETEYYGLDDDRHVWDMEQVLNVWVCPFDSALSGISGRSYLPYFDSDEVMEYCYALMEGAASGIFLSNDVMHDYGAAMFFAHEAGHFLGLEEAFYPDGCDDTPLYDINAYLVNDYPSFYRTDIDGNRCVADNIMDYMYALGAGITPQQYERIRYTLQYAYFIPGPAGKTLTAAPAQRPVRRQGIQFPGRPAVQHRAPTPRR